jgi:DNA-binding MarR family transcriptional regulator
MSASSAPQGRGHRKPSHADVAMLVDALNLLTQWIRRQSLQDEMTRMSGFRLERTGYSILSALEDRGPLRATDLVGLFGLDQSTLSRRLAALAGASLVERNPDNLDARAALVSISPAGRKVLQQRRQAVIDQYEAIVTEWTPDDVAALAGLLRSLAMSIAQHVQTTESTT